jgi:hypothetical protein
MLDMIISNEAHASLPEPVQAEYQERDGQFQLQVDGAYSRIDRDTLQRSLEAERGDHKTAKQRLASFGEITPERFETVWTECAERGVRLESAPAAGDIESAANRISETRVQSAVRPLERQIASLTEERNTAVQRGDTLEGTINTAKVTDGVLKAFGAKAVGGITDAKPDVELFAARTFELNEAGEVVSRDVDGIVSGLTPKEVFADMLSKSERRHWFAATTGAGARPGGGNDLKNNIFKVDSTTGKVPNLTACMQLIKTDPASAKRMIAQAGTQASYPTLFTTGA